MNAQKAAAAPVAPVAAVPPSSSAPSAASASPATTTTAAAAAAPAPPAKPFPFVAPDGVGFSDRGEYRKYLFANFYSYSNRSGETLTKAPGEIAGQPFALEDLRGCTVRLCDHSETVQVDRVTDCRIFIAACCESVFLRNLTNCTVTLACKQLRTRDCVNCTIFLYSKTDPIIEASTGMRFAPFNGAYPGLEGHMRAASLDPRYNHWRRIFDFSADSPNLPRPHWTFLGEDEWGEGGERCGRVLLARPNPHTRSRILSLSLFPLARRRRRVH
jgi:hypothetical protein